MDWTDIQALLIVSESRTQTEAARKLGISVPTLSRRIASLERATGLRLVDRRSGGITLTLEGGALVERARPMTDLAASAERLAAVLRSGGWAGLVRISATEPIICEILAPALPAFVEAHRDVHLDLVASNAIVSLSAREAELAVRFSRPSEGRLAARRLASLRFGLFAAAAYLRGRDPAALRLEDERLLAYDHTFGDTPEASWFGAPGLQAAIVARSSSTRGLARAAAAGAGIALLPVVVGSRTSGLVAIPSERAMPARSVWLVVHQDLQRSDVIRRVIDWVVAAFETVGRDEPAGRDAAR
ncbi:MAG: LysR family transcriptional regulator [Methylobacteriaceae bacterium]|nr:LysR family transcriptional regulator [Methylobacteriaceae bacterium]